MTESTINEKRSISLLRWIGYGLLLFGLLNIIDLFVPLRLMNPNWELSTIGRLVERVIVPLLGLAMVFYGQANYREDWEIPLLKGLSWACLLVSLLYALLIPLGISSTMNLYALAQKQFTTQVSQQLTQMQEVKTQLKNAEGKELKMLFVKLKSPGTPLPINNPTELSNLKGRFLSEINKTEVTLKHQTMFQTDPGIVLIKNAIKSNLGAIICSILFVRIWRITRWARHLA